MSFITHFISYFVVFYTLIILPVGVGTYRKPQYHNTRTLLALIALAILALAALFLLIAQARSLIPVRKTSYTLFEAIFMLTLAIQQSAFYSSSLKGRGWYIFRICFAVYAIALTIFAVIVYVYNL